MRSQAQALWRTLNASPEDAMKDAQRLEALEAQMKASLEQSKRQSQDIAALAGQLQAAQQARYWNPFTLFLGLLTLLALGLSVWLWRRNSAGSSPWYSGNAQRLPQDEAHLWSKFEEDDADLRASTASVQIVPSSPMSSATPLAAQQPMPTDAPLQSASKSRDERAFRFAQRPIAPLDFKTDSQSVSLQTAKIAPLGTSVPAGRGGSMGRVDSTPPPSLMPSTSAAASAAGSKTILRANAGSSDYGHTDFGTSNFSSSRYVAAEELFDIQEQADFFMSLGQPEQAIEVLQNHISDNVETSAVAYMDLFDIYHRTNRAKDYTQLREEFNRVFNAQVPDFQHFGQYSKGLEAYPDALAQIQRYWPGPQSLEMIEEMIFRQPDATSQPFDMQAYRELMLLYTLAKTSTSQARCFSLRRN
ncbi:MAG: hypothetical protein HC858_05175 [Brachymonas sp.]|nr:hypothetical protein [Brachymonas sp.]